MPAQRGARVSEGMPPIRELSEIDLRDLVTEGAGLRATILLPLEATLTGSQRNAVVRRHAMEALGKKLAGWEVDPGEQERWTARLEAVRLDPRQRGHGARGLLVLMDERATWVHPLVVDVEPAVHVARDFRLRELLRSLRRERPWRVLAVSTNRVRLLAGDAGGLEPVDAAELPGSMEDALGRQLEEPYLGVRGAGPGNVPHRFGVGGAGDERPVDLERFHRALATALRKEVDEDDGPLVLVADETHQAGLRAVLELPTLLPEGVEGNPDHWSEAELHERAWPRVLAAIEAGERAASEQWEQARRRGKGAERLADVAAAAAAGRVHRLWVDAGRGEPGRVDPERGDVIPGSGDDDTLDAIVALVLRHGGQVHAVPGDSLPEDHPALAELR